MERNLKCELSCISAFSLTDRKFDNTCRDLEKKIVRRWRGKKGGGGGRREVERGGGREVEGGGGRRETVKE